MDTIELAKLVIVVSGISLMILFLVMAHRFIILGERILAAKKEKSAQKQMLFGTYLGNDEIEINGKCYPLQDGDAFTPGDPVILTGQNETLDRFRRER